MEEGESSLFCVPGLWCLCKGSFYVSLFLNSEIKLGKRRKEGANLWRWVAFINLFINLP